MATAREIRTLSDPAIYVDDRRLKIIPNSCSVELPGEVKSRAVSAGGGAYDIVHGVDAEAFVCTVKFDLAYTRENLEFVLDYKARAQIIDVSTLKIVDGTSQLIYDRMILTNKIEATHEAEGKISLEWMGRFTGV